MKLLVVSHNYPRFPGDPAGAFVARLAEGLAGAGAAVRAVVPHAPGTPEREASAAGVEVRRFRYGPERLERVAYTGRLHESAARPLVAAMLGPFLWAFRRRIREEIAAFGPDLIHAHWWLPAGWLAGGRGKPVIVTCHGSDVRLLERHRAARILGRRVLRRADRVTTVSEFLRHDLERLVGPLPRAAVLRMPIAVDRFAAGRATPKAEPPRVLYAGNLLPSKGVDLLVRAVAAVSRRGVPVSLRVLGEGAEGPALRRLAEAGGIGSSVQWSGFVPQETMPAEYGAATITVLPTRGQAEGLGLTLVEALAAGSAVIGSRAGGIPEVVRDRETGLLFDPGDLAGLVAAIVALLTNPSLRAETIDRGARLVADQFGEARATRAFHAMMTDVLAG